MGVAFRSGKKKRETDLRDKRFPAKGKKKTRKGTCGNREPNQKNFSPYLKKDGKGEVYVGRGRE